jgi:hypothetical protein
MRTLRIIGLVSMAWIFLAGYLVRSALRWRPY